MVRGFKAGSGPRMGGTITQDRRAAQGAPGCNIYIRGLQDNLTDEDLAVMFATCGRIVSSKLLRDQDGATRGVGFVQFAAVEDANRAIADMDGRKIAGRALYVAPAHRKPDLRVRGDGSSGLSSSGGGGGNLGQMYEAVQASPQWGMLAGGYPGGSMPQVYWQGGGPGIPYPMYQAPYQMPAGYGIPQNAGPGFVPNFWAPGGGGTPAGGAFAPGFAPQMPAPMYGSPGPPGQYDHMHRTILQQQQQAHQMQFQMQTGGHAAAHTRQVGGSRGPAPPHHQLGPRYVGPPQQGPNPYGPRPAPAHPGARSQPFTPPSRGGRGRSNAQGGRGGPRSFRSGSADFDTAMSGGRSVSRSVSAGSAPLKPPQAATPQPMPQPMPQPLVAPLANGNSEAAGTPQQQEPAPPLPQLSAVATAVPLRVQFEAELGSVAVEERKGRLGEELYPLIMKLQPEASIAAKMTGMILELDNNQLVDLVFSHALLSEQVADATEVLRLASCDDGTPLAPATPNVTGMPAPATLALSSVQVAAVSSNGRAESTPGNRGSSVGCRTSAGGSSATSAPPHANIGGRTPAAAQRPRPVPYGVPVNMNGPSNSCLPRSAPHPEHSPRMVDAAMAKLDMNS